MTADAPTPILQPVRSGGEGDFVEPLELRPPGPYVIGRSTDADWPLPEQSVSRRHAQLERREGAWVLTDLKSRHGTVVNGRRLDDSQSVTLVPGDLIAFGTWTCRCQSGPRRPGVTTPFMMRDDANASIAPIDRTRLSGIAQRGLEALLELTRSLEHAKSDEDIAHAVVRAVDRATRCPRVFVTRPATGDEHETLASNTAEPTMLSRSLINAAASRGLVELNTAGQSAEQTHSIMQLSIRSAICAPILSSGEPAAFLTLDTRTTERTLPPDAASFCQSVADLAGMALERLIAAELAVRHEQLTRDLSAARRAQELLSPAASGTLGLISYVFEAHAGRVVAGDLFDILALDAHRTAFFLGDVSGKGVGAAVLMAAAQSQLRTHLLNGAPLAKAVGAVSADLFRRTDPSKFVTLLACVVDAQASELHIVDAGHGWFAVSPASGEPVQIEAPHGFPLGVVAEAEYEPHTVPFTAGSQAVLFSDGAVEQPNPAGEQFGYDAVLRSIARANDPATITQAIVADVRAHAAGEFADDLTVACVRLRDPD